MAVKAHRSSYTLPLIGALVALLTLLAVLQYHWLGQISVGERQTMLTNLRDQARRFQEELNNEIDRACSRFQISSTDLRNNEWGELIARYDRWKANSSYPNLVKNLFLARIDAGAGLDLMRFNQTTKQFEPCDWPADLAGLRKQFEPGQMALRHEPERKEVDRKEAQRIEAERKFFMLVEHGYIAEEIPAVVRFITDRKHLEETEPGEPGEQVKMRTPLPPHPSGLAIIALDIDYIRQTVIPALFKRRFTIDGALDFDLAVVYRSIPDEKEERAIKEAEARSGLTTAGDVTINMFNMGVDSAEINRGSRWQIVITHQAGSLDAAVTQARHRNLFASFGILFLLAVSVIIIILNSRRTQQLARKQMEFVAGVSHEFRTPLAVIHAISENLADGLITDKQQIEQCGIVIRNDVRRLAGMVEQVLELAGAFRGKNLYQPQPVDLTELIEQVLAGYPMFEPENEWRIEKEIEPNLPAVMADPAALASAIRNIIDNAVKYGNDNRWIGISAHSRVSDHARTVEVIIEDKGIGIPPSDVPYIFDPFYRGREVVAAQLHGNGLGLSLVKNIIEAHGGTITVTSAPGEGSSFTLNLPAASVTGPPAGSQEGRYEASSNYRR